MAHQTFFKHQAPSGKAARLARRRDRKNHEDREKVAVRRRERRRCRFPLCPCTYRRMVGEVSHDRHKGSGGDPSGERSDRRWMVYVCLWRHQQGRVSFHAENLATTYLEPEKGYEGPVAWLIKASTLRRLRLEFPDEPFEWVEVARERQPGLLEQLAPWQERILTRLRVMDV